MLKEKLLEDLKTSMKEKNETRKNAVQMVRAAILQVEKDNAITLEDDKITEIIAKEVKKRKDSLEDYKKGGREDIVTQVEEATTLKDMGTVMKASKEKMGASADGKTINEIVKSLLS